MRELARSAVIAVAFGLGLVAHDATQDETKITPVAPAAPEIVLGSPAAVVVATDGAPVLINYGTKTQVWFYADEEGHTEPRYHVNQGIIVRVRR